jgi:8-oxo-dGTP pyrophosphatase MutT (NUDIX family)
MIKAMEKKEKFKNKIYIALQHSSCSNLQCQGKIASVLVPLFWKWEECYLVLTKRSQYVEHHKGEISFPGGAKEKEDVSLSETALRETEEEIGLCFNKVEILGKLDDTKTLGSNFVISPFVGWFEYPCSFCMNPLETEELLEIPLNFFLKKKNYWKSSFEDGGRKLEGHFYQWENNIIWGATARILYNFCEKLLVFES